MSETFCKANPPQLRKNYDLEKRKYVIGAFVVLIAIIYSVRLFDLQINDAKYKRSADSNAFLKKTCQAVYLMFPFRTAMCFC